jgi:N-carbamoyl-L-amino-acid hydrolase
MKQSFERYRRVVLAGAVAMSGVIGAAARGAPPTEPRIDPTRLQGTLEQLSVYGRPADGSFADGVSRVAYSDADVAGRAYALRLMREAGLDPHVDAAGNITGTRAGSDSSLKPIIIGSHIDSVPRGGNFDGQVGSMSAIEVVRALNDHHVKTRHPIEVTLWSNEEGGPIGSSAVVQAIAPEILDRSFNGVRMRDGLEKIGGDPDHIAQAQRAPHSFHAYIELHIEQGAVLDKASIPIGVVDGIVSIDEYDVEVHGFANHAGTTPMDQRHDALLAAAKIVEAVREITTRSPGRQVGTVGRLEVSPNAPNVIPGLVKLSVEFRDLSDAKIAALGAETAARLQQIASDTGTQITMTRALHDVPALADVRIQREIEAAAKSLGLATLHLPSGAGHDAQNLAQLGPMAMIFIPSIGGISHSPKELSRWSDVANGADVLLRTVLGVDRSEL